MTIINPNSIAGITSVTAQAGVMNFYKSDGTLAGLQLNGVNFNTTSGISTFNDVYVGGTITYEDVKNVDSVGIVTARAGIIDSTLTAGRVVYVDSDKSLTDSANLTFNGNNVTLEDGRLFVKKGTIPSVDVRNSTNTSHARVILQQGAAEGGYFQISREGTNSSSGDGANSVTLLQSSNHPLIIKTNTTERLRCDGDGVKTLNGRFYSAGTFAYIESSSTSTTTLTLRKTASGADAIDYLQLRDNSNALKLKIGGDGIIYTPDVLASHEGDTNTKIRFPAADTIAFDTGGSERLRINSSGYVGVKRSTPLANLHTTNNELAIGANPTSAAAPNATYDGLVVDGEAGSWINIRSRGDGNTAYGRLAFSDDTRGRGHIEYRHKDGSGDDWMGFQTAGSEKLRITSTGTFGFNTTAPYAYDTTATTFEVKGSVASAADTEVARFRGGSDANGGTAVLRLTNDNDRGLVVKGGRESDAEFAEFGTSSFNGTYTRGIRLDSSGRVLIGTTTEGHADADDLTIATSGSTGITLRCATNGAGSIFFSDATSGIAEYDGFVQFYHNDKHFRLGINNDEKLRVTSGGTLVLGDPESASASGLIHLYQASNDPYIYIQRGSGDSATTIGGIFFKNSTNNLGLISVRSSDINDGSMKFSTMNAGTLGEKLIIQPSGNLDVYANTVHLYNNTDTSNTYFYAQNTAAGNAGIKMKNNQGEWTIIANDRLRFIDDDASSERLSIENDGNVKVWNGGRITILSANNNGQTTTLLKIGSQGNGSETRAIDMDGNWSTNESKSITYTHGSGATNMIAQMNVQYTNPGSRFRWGKLYHSGDSSTYTMYLKSISTTKAELGVYGHVVVNSNPSNYIPLACQPTQGNTGCFIGQSQAYNTAYSLLPWTNGGTYISSGIYYDNGSWVHRSQGNDNCLLYFKGSGWGWYSSNNGSSSWNVANNVSIMDSAGQWTGGTSSDRRLKDNITNMSTSDALTKVSQLQGVSYTWKDEVQKKFGTGPYPEGTHYGFIAQDVKTVWPEAHIISDVDNESDFDDDPTKDVKDDVYYGEIEGVKMEKMVPLLVEAIKELKKENDALKARVTTLEG